MQIFRAVGEVEAEAGHPEVASNRAILVCIHDRQKCNWIQHAKPRQALAKPLAKDKVIRRQSEEILVARHDEVRPRCSGRIDIRLVLLRAWIIEDVAHMTNQRRAKNQLCRERFEPQFIQSSQLLTHDRILQNGAEFPQHRTADKNLDDSALKKFQRSTCRPKVIGNGLNNDIAIENNARPTNGAHLEEFRRDRERERIALRAMHTASSNSSSVTPLFANALRTVDKTSSKLDVAASISVSMNVWGVWPNALAFSAAALK
jgi:hypothetical protein